MKFATTAARRRGLGLVKKGNTYGVVAHAVIAVDAAGHACLSLVSGDVQTRDGVVTQPHRDRPLSALESRRWVETPERAKDVLSSAALVTVVADRESDMYPAWAGVPQPGFHLLSRAMVDRRLAGGGTLFNATDSFQVAGTCEIKLPARLPDQAARTTMVALRYGEVEICRP